jgi:hypothetical protein
LSVLKASSETTIDAAILFKVSFASLKNLHSQAQSKSSGHSPRSNSVSNFDPIKAANV